MLGIFIGVGVFVTTAGIGSSLAGEVNSDFEAILATEMTLRAGEGTSAEIEWTDPRRIDAARRIRGVVAAGVMTEGNGLPASNIRLDIATEITVRGADPAAIEIIEPSFVAGGPYGRFADSAGSPVVVLPASVAARLHISAIGSIVDLQGTEFTVVGIFDDVRRRLDTGSNALVPVKMFQRLTSYPAPEVLLRIEVGAGSFVAPRAKLALAPELPEALVASSPPDPRNFRRTIEGTVERLTLTMSLVALVIGGLTIANSATASVYARIPELGLRAAIGAPARLTFGHP